MEKILDALISVASTLLAFFSGWGLTVLSARRADKKEIEKKANNVILEFRLIDEPSRVSPNNGTGTANDILFELTLVLRNNGTGTANKITLALGADVSEIPKLEAGSEEVFVLARSPRTNFVNISYYLQNGERKKTKRSLIALCQNKP